MRMVGGIEGEGELRTKQKATPPFRETSPGVVEEKVARLNGGRRRRTERSSGHAIDNQTAQSARAGVGAVRSAPFNAQRDGGHGSPNKISRSHEMNLLLFPFFVGRRLRTCSVPVTLTHAINTIRCYASNRAELQIGSKMTAADIDAKNCTVAGWFYLKVISPPLAIEVVGDALKYNGGG